MRQHELVSTNPKRSDNCRRRTSDIGAQDAVAKLAEKGIKVSENLFYFLKCQLKGRKARRTKVQKTITNVAESTHVTRSDALTPIRKVKALASEVGDMKTLKALVEALSV